MATHMWGEEGFDWVGLDKAIVFIGENLRKKWRVPVMQIKEKYGTARIYCGFGWYQMHCITHPGYAFSQYPKWLWKLDCYCLSNIVQLLNFIVVPVHKWAYRYYYKKAVERWPHLTEEILCDADWPELLTSIVPTSMLSQLKDAPPIKEGENNNADNKEL